MGKYILKNCKICGKEFKTYLYTINRGDGKYCSRKCYNISLKNNKHSLGYVHTKETREKMSRSGKGRIFTLEHRKNMSGENNGRWKGGEKASKERKRNNLKYQLKRRISRLIHFSLKEGKKNYSHWEDLVGYTAMDLEKRLKKTMPEGYTWQDFIEGKLHIDHIIPLSVFNFNCTEHIDFKRCWSLDNLQLLPAKENISKHNKLEQDFQPSFKL